jgi:hypothetical protein
MKRSEWLDLVARIQAFWPGQKWPADTIALSFDLFIKIPSQDAIKELEKIAGEGREFAPAPSVLLARCRNASDSSALARWDEAYNNEPTLTPEEHSASMIKLRALETEEQRRRADRVSYETKGLAMSQRFKIASEVLLPPGSASPPDSWDLAFEARLQDELIPF